MNKKTVLAFIKKYPMSILLAIIALNLFSIAGSLKENAKLAYYQEVCARYFAFYSYGTDEQAESNELITSKKVKVPVELVDAYCQRIVDF
tara:strand:- start:158 stop:427 length:270 start_codon:yes stop_codon:yes gene_type:complete